MGMTMTEKILAQHAGRDVAVSYTHLTLPRWIWF